MENNENSVTMETTETIKRPKNPTVLVKARVIKRGENWLFVQQMDEWFNKQAFEEAALFLINISKYNQNAGDIKEGRTYEFLLDLSSDVNRKTKKIECKYWLNKFKQSEF